MTKDEVDFESWFDILRVNVLEQTGVDFKDADSVREQYESGDDVYDVADSIADEYSNGDPDEDE